MGSSRRVNESAGLIVRSHKVESILLEVQVERQGPAEPQSIHHRKAGRIGVRDRLIRIVLDNFPRPLLIIGSHTFHRPDIGQKPLAGNLSTESGEQKGGALRHNKVRQQRLSFGPPHASNSCFRGFMPGVIAIKQGIERTGIYEDPRHLARSPSAK